MLLELVNEIGLLVFMVLCLIVKAEQLAAQAGDLMTEELHRDFFYDTEAIANVMSSVLIASVVIAACVSMRQAGPAAAQAWQEAFALEEEPPAPESTSTAQKLARRAAARARLRSVLDHRVRRSRCAAHVRRRCGAQPGASRPDGGCEGGAG